MCLSTTNDETPRTCAFCNAPITDACTDAQEIGICQPCYDCDGVPPGHRNDSAYDSERYLNSAWQEEQYSARYEDRYGPGYDPYED